MSVEQKMDAVQARRFWNQCMESKAAATIVAHYDVPTEIRIASLGNHKLLTEEEVKEQALEVAQFLREIATALESGGPYARQKKIGRTVQTN